MIFKNKKGWTAKDFIISTVIFSASIALFIIMVASLADDYDNNNIINENFSRQFDTFQNDTAGINNMWEALTAEGGLTLVGTADLLFFGTFRVIGLIFNAVISASSHILGFGTFFDIPTEITAVFLTLIFVILVVSIIFIVLNSVRGSKEL